METHPGSVRTPSDRSGGEKEQLFIQPDASHDVTVDEVDGLTEVTVPISSTTTHRSGSRMTSSALESMVEQLQEGTVGLWDDHGLGESGWREYRREDRYGWWVDGFIDDDEVLWGTARLLEGRSESESLVEELEAGAPVAFSIGYFPLEDDYVELEDGRERREILEVDLTETSSVGIPDNPDAYADGGAAKQIAHSLDEAGIELDRESASVVAHSVTDALNNMDGHDNEDDEDDEAEESNTESEASEADEEEEENTHASAEEAAAAVVGIYESHMEAAAEDVSEWLEENADEEEESSESDEEEEEGAADDDKDKDNNANSAELEELRAELEEVRSKNEDLEAKVDRVESETRQSEGRQGITPASGSGGGSEEETNNGESTESHTNAPRNAFEEAQLLEDD